VVVEMSGVAQAAEAAPIGPLNLIFNDYLNISRKEIN